MGPLAPNNLLSQGRVILKGQVFGPESFAMDNRGGCCKVRQGWVLYGTAGVGVV